jgi:hypothetical protein
MLVSLPQHQELKKELHFVILNGMEIKLKKTLVIQNHFSFEQAFWYVPMLIRLTRWWTRK